MKNIGNNVFHSYWDIYITIILSNDSSDSIAKGIYYIQVKIWTA